MSPIQNTFSIIPNAPSDLPADSRPSKRPMTTKQAKKAYREANKAPKLSKAERRRQELFEQDRIRKELEKERNQARARAARDKKKDKEEQERAEKKKKGLPLVTVRASQHTIARFLRTTKKPSSRESTEEQENGTDQNRASPSPSLSSPSSPPEENPEPPAKRQRLGEPVPDQGDKGLSPPSPAPCSQREVDEVAIPSSLENATSSARRNSQKSQKSRESRENQESQGKPLTAEHVDDQLLTDSMGVKCKLRPEKPTDQRREPELPQENNVPAKPLPARSSEPSFSHVEPEKPLALAERATRNNAHSTPNPRPLRDISTSETNARATKPPREAIITPGKQGIAPRPVIKSLVQIPRKPQISDPIPQAFRHPKTSMLPPPIPPKFKSPKTTPASGPRAPQFLKPVCKPQTPQTTTDPGQRSTPRIGQGELPPSSTQLFMFSHLDDFFPSPSQEVRELFEEPRISPVRTSPQAILGRARTAGPTLAQPRSPHIISTTITRPEPLATPAAQVPARRDRIKESISSSPPKSPAMSAVVMPPDSLDAFDMPFFSTQDFCLSSQDMKDIEDDTCSSLHKSQAAETRNKSINTLRSNLTGLREPTTPNVVTKASAKSNRYPDPIGDEYSNLDLSSKRKREPRQSAPAQSSKEQSQVAYSSILGRPNVYSHNTKGARDGNALVSRNGSTMPVGGPSSISKRPDNISTTVTASRQTRAPSIGRAQHRMSSDKSPAVPPSSPKPFLTSGSREMRYKYAVERSKTSAWEDAKARRHAQEKLNQLQALEDERLIELLADTEEEDGKPAKGDQAGKPDAITIESNQAGSQPRSQRKAPATNQPSRPGPKRVMSDVTKEKNEKGRVPNRARSSYEQMLELLRQAQSPEIQHKKQNNQRAASPETDYEDAWDDDLCDIL